MAEHCCAWEDSNQFIERRLLDPAINYPCLFLSLSRPCVLYIGATNKIGHASGNVAITSLKKACQLRCGARIPAAKMHCRCCCEYAPSGSRCCWNRDSCIS